MESVLVTGMSGTGKAALLHALTRRGFHAVDTDYDGWTLDPGPWTLGVGTRRG
ncbi:adenylylsulfate kinase-like enzyme [Mycobacteroides chelonae]|nr:adenylylsulfate kinase-like enzyme [Mycobacteroides chelonae]